MTILTYWTFVYFSNAYRNKLSVLSVISGKNVGPKLTLKPNTKASSLQSLKTEIKADIRGKKTRNKRRIYGLLVNGRDLRHYTKQVKSRAGERFIHEAHSFMSVSFYTYLCIYVCLYLQLPLDDINSVALEWIVRGTLAELSKNLLISLSLRNKMILSKLEAVVCESYGWLFAWSPLGNYLEELLVKKWYNAHILLG